jgi:hypothetical protein
MTNPINIYLTINYFINSRNVSMDSPWVEWNKAYKNISRTINPAFKKTKHIVMYCIPRQGVPKQVISE